MRTSSYQILLATASLAALVAISACSSQPMSEEAVAKAEADCQVTGSNLKRRSADCATARKGSGVQDVSPEALDAAKSKSAGGTGVKGQ